MFDSLTADELAELQELIYSNFTQAQQASNVVRGCADWAGVEPMAWEFLYLYREVSNALGNALFAKAS